MPALALSKESILRSIPEIEAIDEPIVGGQKAVYRVRVQGTYYALKVVVTEPSPSPDPEAVTLSDFKETIARVGREIETLKACNVPQLARMGPIPLTNKKIDRRDVFYYTEEWIQGESLRTIMDNDRQLDIEEIVHLGIDIAKAIERLWSLSKVHRDIKPSNIMRRESNNRFVLLDFGIALDLADVSLTKTGFWPGSFPYYSPEQTYPANKRHMDFRSDLFALGIVLYEAITGTLPFIAEDSDPDDTIENIRSTPPRLMASFRRDIPRELNQIVTRLLAKKPHLRYGSCEQLCSEFSKVPTSKGGMV